MDGLEEKLGSLLSDPTAMEKLRQLAGVSDPVPVDRVLAPPRAKEAGPAGDCGAEEVPCVDVVRARAVWLEVAASAGGSPTSLVARIDALVDPERVEDANMLRGWRERYDNEITVRTRKQWWRRLLKAKESAA